MKNIYMQQRLKTNVRKKVFLYLSAFLIAFTSCENQQSSSPSAKFTYDVNGKTVTFKDMSTDHDALYNVWDFGDGTKKELRSNIVTHTYKNAGIYDVTLSVLSIDHSMRDRVTQQVTTFNDGGTGGTGGTGGGTGGTGGGDDPIYPDAAKECYLKSFTVKYISFTNENGNYWDDTSGDGPDIYLRIYDGDDEIYNFDYNKIDDVTNADIPFTSPIGVTLTNLKKIYTFKLCDYDTFFVDIMYSFTFNPQQFVYDKPTRLTSNNGKFEVELTVEWR